MRYVISNFNIVDMYIYIYMNRIGSRNSWSVPSPRQELASTCDALRMMSNKLSAIPKPSRSLSLGCTALVSTQVVCAEVFFNQAERQKPLESCNSLAVDIR